MSLLLNGAKTMTFAGTEMQCLEIYTGEAYTLPINFTYSNGAPINCTQPNNWTLATSAKFYNVDTVTYPTASTVDLGNLSLLSPQPNTGANTYSVNLVANFSNISLGEAYLFVPADITGNTNGDGTPIVNLANSGANSTLVIITLTVTRESDANASLDNVNREPLGFIVRYQ